MLPHVMLLVVYIAIVTPPVALIAWMLIRRAARMGPASSTGVASIFWGAMVAPPIAGLVADGIRAPVSCAPREECADYILWLLAIPVGWLLAIVVLGASIVGGRRATPRAADTNPKSAI